MPCVCTLWCARVRARCARKELPQRRDAAVGTAREEVGSRVADRRHDEPRRAAGWSDEHRQRRGRAAGRRVPARLLVIVLRRQPLQHAAVGALAHVCGVGAQDRVANRRVSRCKRLGEHALRVLRETQMLRREVRAQHRRAHLRREPAVLLAVAVEHAENSDFSRRQRNEDHVLILLPKTACAAFMREKRVRHER